MGEAGTACKYAGFNLFYALRYRDAGQTGAASKGLPSKISEVLGQDDAGDIRPAGKGVCGDHGDGIVQDHIAAGPLVLDQTALLAKDPLGLLLGLLVDGAGKEKLTPVAGEAAAAINGTPFLQLIVIKEADGQALFVHGLEQGPIGRFTEGMVGPGRGIADVVPGPGVEILQRTREAPAARARKFHGKVFLERVPGDAATDPQAVSALKFPGPQNRVDQVQILLGPETI